MASLAASMSTSLLRVAVPPLEDVVRHVFLLLVVVVGVVLSGLLEGGLDDDADGLLLLVGEVVPDVLHRLIVVLFGIPVIGRVRTAIVSVRQSIAEDGHEGLRVLEIPVAVLNVHLVDLRLRVGPLEDERDLGEIGVGDDGTVLLDPGGEDGQTVERPVLHLGAGGPPLGSVVEEDVGADPLRHVLDEGVAENVADRLMVVLEDDGHLATIVSCEGAGGQSEAVRAGDVVPRRPPGDVGLPLTSHYDSSLGSA